jgi:hypothetical protein
MFYNWVISQQESVRVTPLVGVDLMFCEFSSY